MANYRWIIAAPFVLSFQQNRLTEADLWVGAEIPVLGRNLVLLRADEYTLHHMELVGHPQADVEHAMDKLRQSLKGKLFLSNQF